MHKVNMSLGEKIISSVQTVSHGWLERRTSEGAVPSTGYIPVSLNRAGCHGPLFQALAWINKAGALNNLPYVFDYLLGMHRINFILHYFLCLWSLSIMPKNLAAFLKKGEYFILELKSAGLQCALRPRGFNVERKTLLSILQIYTKKSSRLRRLQMSNVHPWCPTRRLNVPGRYQSNDYEEY